MLNQYIYDDTHLDTGEIDINKFFGDSDDMQSENDNANDNHSTTELELTNDKLDNTMNSEEDEVKYKWHVVNVAKNSELAFKNSLLVFAEQYNIQKIYIPMEKIKRWKNQKQIEEMKPVMNYVFVLCPLNVLNDRFLKTQIKTRYSVINTISDSEIKQMELTFSNIETVIDTSISEGSRVYITAGSFSGLYGQIQKIHDTSAEVKVWLMEDCEPTNIIVSLADLVHQSHYAKNY